MSINDYLSHLVYLSVNGIVQGILIGIAILSVLAMLDIFKQSS